MLYLGFGFLRYSKGGYWAVVDIDKEIGKYYYSLIPKYKGAKPQAHPPHITAVRKDREIPLNLDKWGKHERAAINFRYSPEIQFDGLYYFLNAYSIEIGMIRQELGLPAYRSVFGSYHITIGNVKPQA